MFGTAPCKQSIRPPSVYILTNLQIARGRPTEWMSGFYHCHATVVDSMVPRECRSAKINTPHSSPLRCETLPHPRPAKFASVGSNGLADDETKLGMANSVYVEHTRVQGMSISAAAGHRNAWLRSVIRDEQSTIT